MLRIALTLACTQFRLVRIGGEELTSFAEVRLSVLTAMSVSVYVRPSPQLLSGVPDNFPFLLLCIYIFSAELLWRP